MLLLCDLCGLARKIIPRQLLFSRKAAEDAKASQRVGNGLVRVSKVIKVFAALARKKYPATVALLSQSRRDFFSQSCMDFSRRANVVTKIFMLLLCGLCGLGEKKISRKLPFSRKAAEDAKASQRVDKGLARVSKVIKVFAALARKNIPRQLLFSSKAQRFFLAKLYGFFSQSKCRYKNIHASPLRSLRPWREKISRDSCSSLAKPQRTQRLRRGWIKKYLVSIKK